MERSQARGKLIGQATERLRKQSVKLAEMESRDAMHDDAATKHHRALPSQYIANPRDTAEQRAKWLKTKKCQPTTQTGTGRIPSAVALVICRPAGRARCANKETHSGAQFLHSHDWRTSLKLATRLDHTSDEAFDIPSLDGQRLAILKGVHAWEPSHSVKRMCEVCIPLDV